MSVYDRHHQWLSEASAHEYSNLQQVVGRTPWLTEADQRQFLEGQTLAELFAQQVQAHPDVIAVSSEQGQMSYGELDRRANQLAHYLCELGVGPETLVGICMERSLELIVGLLGILKAGGAYVPLDPSYPQERLRYIVQDAGMMLILACRSTSHRLESQNTSVRILCWEDLYPNLEQEASGYSQIHVKAQDLAYVIYTSGSTGKPKGVAIRHQSIVTLLHWSPEIVTDEDLVGIVASTSICFDLSAFELFVPLSRGGTVILVKDALHISTIAHERAALINTVPSAARALLNTGGIPASVRTICLAGEPLSGSLVRELYQGTEVQQVYNLYGPSEDTTYSTYALIPPEEQHPPIGHPIANTHAYILDQQLRPVPPGATGDLYIAGAGLARGYLNRPAMTAEAFLPNPWGQEPGERIYSTGDLARYRSDGMLEYRGRRDHQVKLRGFRIELGEIESVLRSQPEVQDAVVEVREVVPGEKSLVAYVIPRPGQKANAPLMCQRLQAVLPAYMVPSFFVPLDTLPLNANGKLDRRALPAPAGKYAEGEKSYQAARTPTEQILSHIWSEMFGRERIGIDDDFFELGGHSLLAMIMLSRVRERLQVNLSLQTAFASRTIRHLAQFLDALPRSEAEPVLQVVSHLEPLAVSFAQQRLWFLDQLEPGMSTYHVPLALQLRGALTWKHLQSSLASLIERHEILRTTFVSHRGQPMQCVAPSSAISMPLVDLSALSPEQRETLVHHLARQEAQRPFDLQQGPLLRALLIRLEAQEHLLVLTLHHIITDGWSEGILWRELATGYEAAEQGQRPAFVPLAVQYADYALWQRQWLSEERMDEHLAYWQQQLAGAPQVLELPTTQPRPTVQRHQGATIRQQLPEALHRKAQAVSQREGVTLFMTLLSAFAITIHRMSGQEDLLLGTAIAGRTRPELEGLIGFFANTLPLRCTFKGNPSGRDFLRQVREMALQAYAHQDVPFEQIVEELQPDRDLSRNPLVQVFLTFEDFATPPSHFGKLVSASVHQVLPTTHFDLTLFVTAQQDGLWLTLEYDTDLFTEASMQRLLEHYQIVLQHLMSDLQQPVGLLPWLAEAEQQQILGEWNATRVPYPQEQTLGALFTQQARRNPDAIAVSSEQGQMSYGELERRANQLAHYLQGLGVEPEMLVGICLERSLELMIGLLGILKAGGGYVPLDPTYPMERLTSMLTDTQAPIVLTQRTFVSRLPQTQGLMICLDVDWERVARESATAPAVQGGTSNIAYVMYTSGSTGQAKGVVISHQAIARLVFQDTYSLVKYGDRVAHASNVSFDATTFEIWKALLQGGCLTCVSQEILLAPPRLAHFLREQAISTMFVTTALFNLLAREVPEIFAGMREVVVGGEAMEQHWVRRVLASGAPERLVNGYGPTECTTFATWYLLRDVSEQAPSLPIGAPLANTEVYVLDQWLQPVPVGVPGELYLGGDGLARGYLNRPELTAERFIPHPFSPQPGARLYRTGDYVCWSEEKPGILEFFGRKDHQVKLRGFRVELGEIENVLRSQPEVQEAVVEVREVVPGEQSLVAYVVPAADSQEDKAESQHLEKEQIGHWETLYNATYRSATDQEDPTFNIFGWNSSYTGLPIPAEDMREQIEQTVARVLAYHPRRVVEIGFGTGMLLFRIAPHTSEYLASDFSLEALSYVQQVLATRPLPQVHLIQQLAHEAMESIESESIDAVIINSVVQYFPNITYLLDVVQKAWKVLQPGGFLFVGDVRNYSLLKAFQSSVEVYRSPASLTRTQVRQRVEQGILREAELLVDPAFFQALQRELPQVGQIQIRLKRGHAHNELTRYRYDVVIHKGVADVVSGERVFWQWFRDVVAVSQIEEYLRSQEPATLHIHRIPNLRLTGDLQSVDWVFGDQRPETVGAWREVQRELEQPGVDPETFWQLGDQLNYRVEINWVSEGKSGEYYEAIFMKGREVQVEERPILPTSMQGSLPTTRLFHYANNPLQGKMAQTWLPCLRTFLRTYLPEYMIPSFFVLLDTLPLNANGKLDRRALPLPERRQMASADVAVDPHTALEDQVAQIWSQVLGVEPIGVDENFFELGGHSLLATQVISRVREAFQVEIPLHVFFKSQTVRGLAQAIEAVSSQEQSKMLLPGSHSRPALLPASPAQQYFWFLDQLEPGNPIYIVPLLLRFSGPLKVQLLEKSIQAVIQRHETLRTTFKLTQGQIIQVVKDTLCAPLSVTNFEPFPESVREEEVQRFLQQQLTCRFDISKGPLLQASLLRLEEHKHLLLIVMHHIISDGWSLSIFFREMVMYYRLFQGEANVMLPLLPIQYADYVLWHNAWFQGETKQKQIDYWMHQLAGAPTTLSLSSSRLQPTTQPYSTYSILLSTSLSDALRQLSQQENVTLFMTLLTGFSVVLASITGSNDLVIGTTVARRTRREIEELIGLFAEVLLLRIGLAGLATWRELLQRVSSVVLEAYDNQDLSYVELQRALRSDKEVSIPFQVLFAMYDVVTDRYVLGDTSIEKSEIMYDASVDLDVHVEDSREIKISFSYKNRRFDADAIHRLADEYKKLLGHLASNRDAKFLPMQEDKHEYRG